MNVELPDAQAGFRKGRGTRDQIANIHCITEKSKVIPEKKHLFLLQQPVYYMQSTSCEMPGWMKHKTESSLLGEISITSDMQMTPHL